jgi:hypothetical protein
MTSLVRIESALPPAVRKFRIIGKFPQVIESPGENDEQERLDSKIHPTSSFEGPRRFADIRSVARIRNDRFPCFEYSPKSTAFPLGVMLSLCFTTGQR